MNFTKQKPLILVTNDDGIMAPGLRHLVSLAMQLGEVLVVAPDSPRSGQGHAITLEEPLRLRKVTYSLPVEAYECSGTPVDCVKLAKNVLLKTRSIDLCVSGINHGSNSSINIIYSGTMSAATEAALENIPSVGFSLLDYSFEADFTQCSKYISKIMKEVMTNPASPFTLLNVNIPKLLEKEIRGIKVCRQGNARWVEDFVESKDPRGQSYYWLTGKFVNEDAGSDTDVYALEQGYISVVPATFDLTHYKQLQHWETLKEIQIDDV